MRSLRKLLGAGLALVLGVVLLISFKSVVSVSADPGILYVAIDADCGGMTPCYSTLQAAVDAANAGDEVRVAAGTYTDINTDAGIAQVVYIDKSINIRGGYTITDWATPNPDTNVTVLNAQKQGRVLYITGNISPTIEGLHITGGDASGLGGWWSDRDAGGGIYVITATATISNNVVYSNTGNQYGGGVALLSSAAHLVGNTIRDNVVSEDSGMGGGVFVFLNDHVNDPQISRNLIQDNSASSGACGGIMVWMNNALVEGNTIISNTAKSGGGLCLYEGEATVYSNLIAFNTAVGGFGSNGGGVLMSSDSSKCVSNTVTSNSADGEGGGFNIKGPGIFDGAILIANTIVSNNASALGGGVAVVVNDAKLTNNVIANNVSGAFGDQIYMRDASPLFLHTTIAHSTVGNNAVYVDQLGTPVIAMTNTILVNHTVGISITGNSTLTLNGILWHNTPVTVSQSNVAVVNVQNQYTGDPAFAPDGFHITSASAALDRGVPTQITTDIDGEIRPQGVAPDLGADEISAAALPESTNSQVTFASSDGVVTELNIPGAAITESLTLVYTPTVPTTFPSDFSFAGRAFDLVAYRGGALLETLSFNPVATIILHFTDADVAGLDEEQLYLYTWNTTAGIWEDAACGDYARHPTENWLSVPICHLSQFALFGIQAPPSPTTITKYVSPEGQVQYGDELTYTLVISGAPGAEVSIYDPLTSTMFIRFVEQPDGIEYASHAITGTMMITPANSMTVSFVTQVGVPGTIGIYVDVSNTACIYPAGQTISWCEWSNTITNRAYRPYTILIPLVIRGQ